MNLQNGHLSEWMTQGGKEMMAGRWRGRGMLGRLDVLDALDQSHYSELY
jgi:hypothetical protein